MTCKAILLRPKDGKILMVEYITEDTYPLCENIIKVKNEKLKRKDEAYWKIWEINI